MCCGANLMRRIECAGVHIAGLDADDRPFIQARKRAGNDATLVVNRYADHPLAPKSHHGERLQHARVHFLSDHNPQRRRTE